MRKRFRRIARLLYKAGLRNDDTALHIFRVEMFHTLPR